jgi:fusion and transport protein UGO1
MTSSASLRDLYSSPSSAWSFLPASGPSGTNGTATSGQWSTRTSHNSIFDLSPSRDLGEPNHVTVTVLFQGLVASAFLQYTSTAIAMPWEVGKTLLQVQWVPRDVGGPDSSPDMVEEEEEEVSIQTNARL